MLMTVAVVGCECIEGAESRLLTLTEEEQICRCHRGEDFFLALTSDLQPLFKRCGAHPGGRVGVVGHGQLLPVKTTSFLPNDKGSSHLQRTKQMSS